MPPKNPPTIPPTTFQKKGSVPFITHLFHLLRPTPSAVSNKGVSTLFSSNKGVSTLFSSNKGVSTLFSIALKLFEYLPTPPGFPPVGKFEQ
jgi:hypothetical protein